VPFALVGLSETEAFKKNGSHMPRQAYAQLGKACKPAVRSAPLVRPLAALNTSSGNTACDVPLSQMDAAT
jgi:hypothetical protein